MSPFRGVWVTRTLQATHCLCKEPVKNDRLSPHEISLNLFPLRKDSFVALVVRCKILFSLQSSAARLF